MPIGILLVDDNKTALMITKNLIERQDSSFQVICASSAAEALSKLAEKELHLIVSDYLMDEMDGLAFLSELRANNIEIPFILLTGLDQEAIAIRALNLGADRYVKKGKPEAIIRELIPYIKQLVRQKQTESALRESEEKFRAIYNNANDGIALANPTSMKYDSCNNTFCDMLGLTQDEVKELRILDIVPQEARAQVEEQFKKQLSGEIALAKDIPVEKKDVSIFYADINASPVVINGTTFVMGIFRDITERKRAEQALNERVKELNCLYGISKLIEQPGISLKTILAKTVKLLPPAWQYPEITGGRITLNDQEYVTEGFQATSWVQSASICVRDQQRGEVAVSYAEKRPNIAGGEGPFLKEERLLIDAIAERLQRSIVQKETEAALRNSEKRYRDLMEKLHEGVLAENTDGCFTFANLRASKLLGYRLEELIGQHWSTIVPPASISQIEEKNKERLTGISDVYETSFQRKDGKVFPILISATPLYNELGEIREILSVFTDLSNYKRMEDQLLLADKMAGLGRIVAGVAHEINNPLAFLHMNSEFLQEHFEKVFSTQGFQQKLEETILQGNLVQAQEMLSSRGSMIDYNEQASMLENFKMIIAENLEGLKKIAGIVEDLKIIGRASSSIEKKETIDLSHLLASTLSLLKYEKKPNVIISLQFEENLPKIRGNPSRLSQAFLNLLHNGVQAIGEEEGSVTVDISADAENVKVSIEDTGIGIPSESIPLIFEPFFTSKLPGEGTGLGLAITHEIIASHYGEISVESEVGVGTKFAVLLPQAITTLSNQ